MKISCETTLNIFETAPDLERVSSSCILSESAVSDEAIFVSENVVRPKTKRPNPLAVLTADEIEGEPITKRESQRSTQKNALPRIPRLSALSLIHI